MEKLIFKDLMDALNMKISNIDKFDIIECYTATRFTIGQIRLLISSLSTTVFRYRALLALVEYMPTVDEYDAVHIVNAISECESQGEIRTKTFVLLVKCNKLQESENIENVYKVITRKSLPENISRILQQNSSTEDNNYINSTIDEIEPITNARLSLAAEENRTDFLFANKNHLMCNKIHPMYAERLGIEDCPSSDSNITSKCCIL